MKSLWGNFAPIQLKHKTNYFRLAAAAFFSVVLLNTSLAQNLTPAQKLITPTGEDSLNQGIAKNKTILSGYGSVYYQHDHNAEKSIITLERFVFFIGHQFNSKIAFFSETEIEILPIEFEHLQQLLTLDFHHRDPFDRIIIAQGIVEKMIILSKDEQFANYTK